MKDLVFLDLETTGISTKNDRIVQIAMIKFKASSKDKEERSILINPGRPIPEKVTEIHGIRDEDVIGEETFEFVAEEISKYLENCDLAGWNILKYDLPLLNNEFERAGLSKISFENTNVIDGYILFKRMESKSLEGACRFYLNEHHNDAHDALADCRATAKVLTAQIKRYGFPRDTKVLGLLSESEDPKYLDSTRKIKWNSNGEAVLAFGKNCGKTLKEMCESSDKEYLQWTLNQDFKEDYKNFIKKSLKGEYPDRMYK